MNLAEIAETVPVRRTGKPCRIAQVRQAFGDADRATFDSYLADPTKSGQWIADLIALSPITIKVSGPQVGYHRRGACTCSR